MTKFRIVKMENGFGRQYWFIEQKLWWWPVWVRYDDSRTNMFSSLENANNKLKEIMNKYDPRQDYKRKEVYGKF